MRTVSITWIFYRITAKLSRTPTSFPCKIVRTGREYRDSRVEERISGRKFPCKRFLNTNTKTKTRHRAARTKELLTYLFRSIKHRFLDTFFTRRQFRKYKSPHLSSWYPSNASLNRRIRRNILYIFSRRPSKAFEFLILREVAIVTRWIHGAHNQSWLRNLVSSLSLFLLCRHFVCVTARYRRTKNVNSKNNHSKESLSHNFIVDCVIQISCGGGGLRLLHDIV